jgi:replicative DNA helicase
MTDNSGKLPPHNREAERSILSIMIRHKRAIEFLPLGLKHEDFYVYGHGRIFDGILALDRDGKTVDYITLGDWLKANQALEDAGGHDYLVNLWDASPRWNAAGIEEYAEIIRNHALARAVIHLGNRLLAMGDEPGPNADDLRDRVAAELFALTTTTDHGAIISQTDAVRAYLEDLDRRCDREEGTVSDDAVPTGFPSLDLLTGGIKLGELTIVAARPSIGKTLMGLILLRNAARFGIPGQLISMEMKDRELIARLFASEARVSSHHLRRAVLDLGERARIKDASPRLTSLPIWYDCTPSQSLFQIANTARRQIARYGIRLMVIDYLQLMEPENRRDPRQEQVSQFSRGLKKLAGQLNIAIVAMAQVNRGPEERADHAPRLSDMRESGSIENDADCALILHKPEGNVRGREEDPLTVNVAKQRNGAVDEVILVHNKPFCDIHEPGLPARARGFA